MKNVKTLYKCLLKGEAKALFERDVDQCGKYFFFFASPCLKVSAGIQSSRYRVHVESSLKASKEQTEC